MTDKYIEVHKNPQGPGDARPTAYDIVKADNLVGAFSDKVALVTGASSGIGVDTALALKLTGARVFAAVRDLEKAKEALKGELEPGKLELVHVHLDDLSSVRAAAKDIRSRTNKLNIIINNAGVMETPEGRTVDGFETQFGTNHLGPFLLFQLLKPLLLSSSTPEFHSRVVNTSSIGHRYARIRFDNLTLEGEYTPGAAYGQAKTANIWMANQIERLYGSGSGSTEGYIHGYSLHPGGIWTGLQKHVDPAQMAQWKKIPAVVNYMKSTAQGAATQVWAAVAKVWEGKGGVYLEDCHLSEPVKEGYQTLEGGYEKWAFDPEGEEKLWKISNELVGFKEE